MGTAEGNRLRPEEHTTGAPVVMRAAVHKSFSALEAEVTAAWLTRVTRGEWPGPFGTNESADHREPRGALAEPGVPPTGFEPVPPP